MAREPEEILGPMDMYVNMVMASQVCIKVKVHQIRECSLSISSISINLLKMKQNESNTDP
jgi:hypothetical protein